MGPADHWRLTISRPTLWKICAMKRRKVVYKSAVERASYQATCSEIGTTDPAAVSNIR
ncbi:hypothetical protein D1BOALGB6SA_5790 [Olavius sp. associated proteobacterium Delta 1]|nr:hypothetical protein D1BOALGB6SA_5790 [Olavius sp. associated proteobacterium Delta 1]